MLLICSPRCRLGDGGASVRGRLRSRQRPSFIERVIPLVRSGKIDEAIKECVTRRQRSPTWLLILRSRSRDEGDLRRRRRGCGSWCCPSYRRLQYLPTLNARALMLVSLVRCRDSARSRRRRDHGGFGQALRPRRSDSASRTFSPWTCILWSVGNLTNRFAILGRLIQRSHRCPRRTTCHRDLACLRSDRRTRRSVLPGLQIPQRRIRHDSRTSFPGHRDDHRALIAAFARSRAERSSSSRCLTWRPPDREVSLNIGRHGKWTIGKAGDPAAHPASSFWSCPRRRAPTAAQHCESSPARAKGCHRPTTGQIRD